MKYVLKTILNKRKIIVFKNFIHQNPQIIPIYDHSFDHDEYEKNLRRNKRNKEDLMPIKATHIDPENDPNVLIKVSINFYNKLACSSQILFCFLFIIFIIIYNLIF